MSDAKPTGSIVYSEFLGNGLLLLLLVLSGIGIPFAVFYWLEKTVWVVDPTDNPGEFVQNFRKRK